MEIRSEKFRVYLKTLSMEDADSIAKYADDKDIAYNIAAIGEFPFPYKKENAVSFIDFASNAWIANQEYHFGIHFLDTNELIGVIGFKNVNHKHRKGEIGYWMGKPFWGGGYMKEAIRLMLYFGFNTLDLNRIYGNVFAFNERSTELLIGLGFTEDGILRENELHGDKFVNDLVMALLKKDYKDAVVVDIDKK